MKIVHPLSAPLYLIDFKKEHGSKPVSFYEDQNQKASQKLNIQEVLNTAVQAYFGQKYEIFTVLAEESIAIQGLHQIKKLIPVNYFIGAARKTLGSSQAFFFDQTNLDLAYTNTLQGFYLNHDSQENTGPMILTFYLEVCKVIQDEQSQVTIAKIIQDNFPGVVAKNNTLHRDPSSLPFDANTEALHLLYLQQTKKVTPFIFSGVDDQRMSQVGEVMNSLGYVINYTTDTLGQKIGSIDPIGKRLDNLIQTETKQIVEIVLSKGEKMRTNESQYRYSEVLVNNFKEESINGAITILESYGIHAIPKTQPTEFNQAEDGVLICRFFGDKLEQVTEQNANEILDLITSGYNTYQAQISIEESRYTQEELDRAIQKAKSNGMETNNKPKVIKPMNGASVLQYTFTNPKAKEQKRVYRPEKVQQIESSYFENDPNTILLNAFLGDDGLKGDLVRVVDSGELLSYVNDHRNNKGELTIIKDLLIRIIKEKKQLFAKGDGYEDALHYIDGLAGTIEILRPGDSISDIFKIQK